MRTLGIDLASQPKNTAACLLEWEDELLWVLEVRENCHDDDLDELISSADTIGIDAPLGWPDAFRAATCQWQSQTWNDQVRDALRFRATDRFVRCLDPQNRPLSVSTDLIALPAMRAMALLERHHSIDRSGRDSRFFEVYPAASLRAWNLPATAYKKADATSAERRRQIVQSLTERLTPIGIPIDRLTGNADALDAWIASLSARAASLGKTHLPPDSETAECAVREGWIHIPTTLELCNPHPPDSQ